MSSEEKREIIFPMGEAFRFSLESIRKRFTRALITAVSIVLGISFMVTLLTMAAILRAVPGTAPPAAYTYWMAAIALLVCGVGIVNSMLMSVTERYNEIGTIKCLGATEGSILKIFLIESAILGLLGGGLGSVIGLSAGIIIYGIQLGFEVVAQAGALTFLIYLGGAIGLGLLLTVAAAAYPAWHAARLNPADALRYAV